MSSFWTGFKERNDGGFPPHNVRMYMQHGKYAGYVRGEFMQHVSTRTLRKIAQQAIRDVKADQGTKTASACDANFFAAVHRSIEILRERGFR